MLNSRGGQWLEGLFTSVAVPSKRMSLCKARSQTCPDMPLWGKAACFCGPCTKFSAKCIAFMTPASHLVKQLASVISAPGCCPACPAAAAWRAGDQWWQPPDQPMQRGRIRGHPAGACGKMCVYSHTIIWMHPVCAYNVQVV